MHMEAQRLTQLKGFDCRDTICTLEELQVDLQDDR